MIDDIYVFDDIIEKPYQELVKETLLGGDKPPTVDNVEEEFPWYYTPDITDASHEGPFQGRFGFSHQYVTAEDGVVSEFHNLFSGLIKNSCKKSIPIAKTKFEFFLSTSNPLSVSPLRMKPAAEKVDKVVFL